MDRIRRSAALTMGLLVLQLSLAAGTSRCDEPAAAAETAHAGMSMPAESDPCNNKAEGASCAPTGHGACQAMVSCMTAALCPATPSQLAIAVARHAAPTDRAAQYETRCTVPDLPPPRA